MKLKIKKAIPLIFLLYGLFYFLEPVLSGWFEIVAPFIARNVFLPIDWMLFVFALPFSFRLGDTNIRFPDTLFWIIFLAYLAYYYLVIRHEAEQRSKKLALLPLLIFPLLFILLIPLGMNSLDRRINSFPLGGWSLLMMAGGPEKVRGEAIQLLDTTTEERPSDSELPISLQIVGGWVGLEHDHHVVVLGRGRMAGMADEFGFIFQKDVTAEPSAHYLERFDFQRFWKLADGVYFYEVP